MKKGTSRPRMTADERREWDELLGHYIGKDREILEAIIAKLTKRERDFVARTIRHLMDVAMRLELKDRGFKNPEAIRLILAWRAQGKSFGDIYLDLNEAGILNDNGKPWTRDSVCMAHKRARENLGY